MKKLLFALIALLPLVGCSDDSDDLSPRINEESGIIRLNAGVKDPVVSRAGPINSGFSTDFPIGVYAYTGSWQAGASANLINNDQATVSGTGLHPITFGSGASYYYPTNGSLVNFFGFAPRATETTAAGAGTAPVVQFDITGQEDIMYATATGTVMTSAVTPPVFNFTHKLTQLQFTFKAGTNYPTTGYSVVSLTVNSQSNSATMNVGTGLLTFSGSANFQALSAANQSAGISITSDGTNANSPVMTQALTSYLLTVIVKPSGGGSNVTYSNIPVSLVTLPGSAHMITLTFNATSITINATVADWLTGAGIGVPVS